MHEKPTPTNVRGGRFPQGLVLPLGESYVPIGAIGSGRHLTSNTIPVNSQKLRHQEKTSNSSHHPLKQYPCPLLPTACQVQEDTILSSHSSLLRTCLFLIVQIENYSPGMLGSLLKVTQLTIRLPKSTFFQPHCL